MIVNRLLNDTEVDNASGLARYVFDTCLRVYMNYPETISCVENYLSEENLKKLSDEGKLLLWGSFDGELMIAVGGMQTDGMITMLYVLPRYANQGHGTTLLDTMIIYANKELKLSKVILNATPAGTSSYFMKKGFKKINANQTVAMPYMSMVADATTRFIYEKKEVSTKLLLTVAASVVTLATILGVGYMIYFFDL